jgi:septum formation protein
MNFNFPIFLASKSPRRQLLLAGLGVPFEVKVVPVDESFPNEMDPAEVPVYLSRKKAMAVAAIEKEALIIGADTVVILDDAILGKPQNAEQAADYLQQLSGNIHEVVTGVCIIHREKVKLFKDITRVQFDTLSNSEIEHYIATCSPFDKAGAYGIQEWIGMVGVSGIEGSYFNVVGLPVHRVYQELKELAGTT